MDREALKQMIPKRYAGKKDAVLEILEKHKNEGREFIVKELKKASIIAPTTYWADVSFFDKLLLEMIKKQILDRKCENCEFWALEEENYGDCRRYTPKLVWSMTALPNTQGYADVKINNAECTAVWPETHGNLWCGEFKPKE